MRRRSQILSRWRSKRRLPTRYPARRGPAPINLYTTCQAEYGVLDCNLTRQAKLAVESRAFPIFICDTRKGEKIHERLSLMGNPAQKEDWWTPPQGDKALTFIDFVRSEGRFAK